MIGSLWDLKRCDNRVESDRGFTIMIGSLWDLKQFSVQVFGSVEVYHDRFPMGFETLVHLRHVSTNLSIMIGSLWDLKLKYAQEAGWCSRYHDRFPMGFETYIFEIYPSPSPLS